MTDEQAVAKQAGKIENVGALDLTGITSADELANITRIKNVGAILIRESLMGKLSSIPMENVGSVVPVPEGDNVRVQTGQIQMSGEALAGGNEEDVLVVTGQLIITSPVQQVGYKALIVSGQVLAPKGSETALGAKLSRLSGQSVYYPGQARIFMGEDQFSQAFFELLDEPITMVLLGDYTIDDDVTVEMVKQKVAAIALFGNLKAPKHLVPIFQVLTTEKHGNIGVKDADA